MPEVLPTKVPNMLVNGSAGIAVGMATNMAPHNLNETLLACLAFIENPEIPTSALPHQPNKSQSRSLCVRVRARV